MGLGSKLVVLAVVLFIAYPLLVKDRDRPAGPSASASASATAPAEATGGTNVTPEKVAATEQQQAQCDTEVKCFAEKHVGDAAVPCRRSIEALASYDFQWIEGPKFSVAEHYPDNPAIITYSGDRIRFQNAFGAWQVMTYACDYNVVSGTAIEARADPK